MSIGDSVFVVDLHELIDRAAGPRVLNSLISTVLPTLGPKCPAPVTLMLAAPPALLVMFSVAFFAPTADGVNVTCATVESPGPRFVVPTAPIENWPASVPVIVGVLSAIGNPLVL